MEIKDLMKFREEIENLIGNIQDLRIEENYIVIQREYMVGLDSLLKLKEYFGVRNLYVERAKYGIKIIVQ